MTGRCLTARTLGQVVPAGVGSPTITRWFRRRAAQLPRREATHDARFRSTGRHPFLQKDGGVVPVQRCSFRPGMLRLRRDSLPRILLAVFSPDTLYACAREKNSTDADRSKVNNTLSGWL